MNGNNYNYNEAPNSSASSSLSYTASRPASAMYHASSRYVPQHNLPISNIVNKVRAPRASCARGNTQCWRRRWRWWCWWLLAVTVTVTTISQSHWEAIMVSIHRFAILSNKASSNSNNNNNNGSLGSINEIAHTRCSCFETNRPKLTESTARPTLSMLPFLSLSLLVTLLCQQYKPGDNAALTWSSESCRRRRAVECFAARYRCGYSLNVSCRPAPAPPCDSLS